MDKMKNYKQFIRQLPNNTLVCALAEFSPPTISHELLIKSVKVVAEEKSAEHIIFTSSSDILREEKKHQYLKLMFPETNFISLGESNVSLVFKKLTENYKNVILVVNEEQSQKYKVLNESNVELITITGKNPDSDYSKMKQYAAKGIYEEFKKLLPSTIRDIDGKLIMNEMRFCMNLDPIKEQIVLVKDKLREQYFRGEVFNVGDIVESDNKQYEIIKRGSNHLLLKEESGALISKWIQDVTVIQEAVIQPNGTDKIETNQPESSKNAQDMQPKPKGKVRGFLTFYNYDDNKKTIREQSVNVDAEAKSKIKAQLILKHAKEKENLSHKQEKEKLALRNEAKVIKTYKQYKTDKPNQDVSRSGNMNAVGGENIKGFTENHLEIPKDAPSVETIAAKHKVSVQEIEKQLKIGMKVEAEHGKNPGSEREIALDHLNEKPDYYKKLKRFVEGVAQPTGDLKKACWKGYTAVGTKKKNGRTVPNCIPESVLNPKDPHKDYIEKRKTLQDLSRNKDVDQKVVQQRRLDLDKEYSKLKEELSQLDEGKMGEIHDDIHTHLGKHVDTYKKVGGADWLGHKTTETAKHISKLHNISQDNAQHLVNQYVDSRINEELEEASPIKKLGKKVIKTDDSDQVDRTQLRPTFDPFFKEEFDLSDQEIDDMVEHVSEDEILSMFEESEWSLVYEDTEEELPVHPEEHLIDLMEVLSRQERMRAKVRLRKTQAKRSRSTKISLHRFANPQTINKRARRLAIKLIKQRMLRGRNLSKISVGEKERIEKSLAQRKDLVNRVAQKLVVRIRRVEKSRMSKGSTKKGNMPAVF